MLTLDSKTKSKLIFACVLLTPIIGVQGARFVLGPGASPASAGAAMPAMPTMPVIPSAMAQSPIRPLTPKQKAAADFLGQRDLAALLRSPMDTPEPLANMLQPAQPLAVPTPVDQAVGAPLVPTAEPSRAAAKPSNDLPPLTLTGLLVNETNKVASLNHRMYRINDQVYPGWRLAVIDSKRRSVTLVGPNGKFVQLSNPAPTLNE